MTAQEVLIVRNERIRWENRLQARTKALIGTGIAHKGQKTFNDIQYIHTKEVIKQMNLKELANSTSIGNITELESIPTDIEVFEENGINKETHKPYSFNYIELNGKKYRIPSSVLSAIAKLDTKNVKVTKTGTGMETRYQVTAV